MARSPQEIKMEMLALLPPHMDKSPDTNIAMLLGIVAQQLYEHEIEIEYLRDQICCPLPRVVALAHMPGSEQVQEEPVKEKVGLRKRWRALWRME